MRWGLFKGVWPQEKGQAMRNVFAGITLASMNIPQVLGYARIAGMPVVTGLYTVLLPVVAFAAFGSSRHLVVAADSATATILSSGLSSMAPSASAHYIALVGMVALLTSLFLLLARLFKLGFLADFLSRTVLVGFLTGVGFQVGIAMLGDMVGVATGTPRTVDKLRILGGHLAQVNMACLVVSAAVVAFILLFKHLLPRVPAPLFAVIGGIGASYQFNFSGQGISVIGEVPGGLPPFGFSWLGWREIVDLIPIAASCFVMIIAQSAAASRVFAERYRERVDADADILGLCAANAAAAASGAFVVNGSPTQTAMAEQAGARSQLAQLVFAGVVTVVLLFFTGPIKYLPHCVLASVVFTIAVGLVDFKNLRAIRRESPGEFSLAVMTAAAVALLGVEQGIIMAITLSVLRHVRHSYQPHTMVLQPDDKGQWMPVPAVPGVETEPGLIVYRFGADLFFANDNRFVDEVRRLVASAPHQVRWFVVDAGAITDLDYSAARSMRDLCQEFSDKHVNLVFARVNTFLKADMDRHCISEVIGADHIFATLHEGLALAHERMGSVAGEGVSR